MRNKSPVAPNIQGLVGLPWGLWDVEHARLRSVVLLFIEEIIASHRALY